MAYHVTMKDVAEAAGVSVGTVSNVIKGDRRTSLSMVQRVQMAIRKTGYHSHLSLRNNSKIRKTHSIGIILPSVQDPNFAGIYTGINHILSENGYAALLCTTSEIQAYEQRAIEQFIKQRVEGIIILTCQPEASGMFQSVYDNGTPLVFIERKPAGPAFPFIEYDCEGQIRILVRDLLAEGRKKPLLIVGPHENSCEAAYEAGFFAALGEDASPGSRGLNVVETNFNKESAFSGLIFRFGVRPHPDAIIATSIPLLTGAMQAVRMLEIDAEPVFVGLGPDTWGPSLPTTARIVRRDSMEMGEAAACMLFDILNGETRRGHVVFERARFNPEIKPRIKNSVRLRGKGKTLRALMLAGSACSALESLLPAFKKNTGLGIEMDKRSVVEIGAMLRDPGTRSHYDIFQIDQPWLGEAAEDGVLHPLDDWYERDPARKDSWLPGALDAYCRHRGRYYSVPFLFGAQMLFYRKDLFDDPHLKSAFRKRHRYSLRAPKNWNEFNQIASFFTRALNPDSPTEFGTTLGGQEPNGAVCEFMPRLLAFHGSFGADNMLESLVSHEAEAALSNYIESYRYAPPGSPDWWWDEQVAIFGQGEAAMMILFLGHVSPLADRSKSRVIGRIGYDIIPGNSPMLGGWTLGVNRESACREAALDFLGWTCDRNLVIPLTILGGMPPASRVYRNSELCALYPWLPRASESFVHSYRRNISAVTTGRRIEEMVFENILGGAVHKAVTRELPPGDALRLARSKLVELMG